MKSKKGRRYLEACSELLLAEYGCMLSCEGVYGNAGDVGPEPGGLIGPY